MNKLILFIIILVLFSINFPICGADYVRDPEIYQFQQLHPADFGEPLWSESGIDINNVTVYRTEDPEIIRQMIEKGLVDVPEEYGQIQINSDGYTDRVFIEAPEISYEIVWVETVFIENHNAPNIVLSENRYLQNLSSSENWRFKLLTSGAVRANGPGTVGTYIDETVHLQIISDAFLLNRTVSKSVDFNVSESYSMKTDSFSYDISENQWIDITKWELYDQITFDAYNYFGFSKGSGTILVPSGYLIQVVEFKEV
ncbi:hypothetical protein MmiEs2_12550 [Methanimicrococcus stummii]|uniref:Uncharacterized protein n=1 Tax=Methanimicrococcus stummii TaxID=3028294 RepID=A0AA96VIN1_9EURY|nr:hypothetical protein [Methanimicrococcus sp. Es2]WNY29041.1 hypothetical protein MmiEs2_12550 [Methanimicrococcus sp. Es2]